MALEYHSWMVVGTVSMDIETTKGFDPLKGLAVIAYFER